MLLDRVLEDSKISDAAQHVRIRKEGGAQTGEGHDNLRSKISFDI